MCAPLSLSCVLKQLLEELLDIVGCNLKWANISQKSKIPINPAKSMVI